MKAKKATTAIDVPSGHLLAGIPSADMEMEMLRRSIMRRAVCIAEMNKSLAVLCKKQVAAEDELTRQIEKANAPAEARCKASPPAGCSQEVHDANG